MSLYAWVTSAFIPKGAPVDHTWITSYDSRINKLATIADVINAGEQYWYCWGSYHPHGRISNPIVICSHATPKAACLVNPNNAKSRGTVHWYGIDGVCHQVANQILYVISSPSGGKPLTVSAARGYKLSSSLYGSYGRREAEWNEVRMRCGVAQTNTRKRGSMVSLLRRRMSQVLQYSINEPQILALEQSRRQLLAELDDIGFARRSSNETTESRVAKMNGRINSFLQVASNAFNNDKGYERVFGIARGVEIYLIDPLLFEFPEPTDRPERGALVGW